MNWKRRWERGEGIDGMCIWGKDWYDRGCCWCIGLWYEKEKDSRVVCNCSLWYGSDRLEWGSDCIWFGWGVWSCLYELSLFLCKVGCYL